MYPPPSPHIVKQLVGRVIELISFGKYVVPISFDNGDRASIACPFRFAPGEAETPLYEFPLAETNLTQALGLARAVLLWVATVKTRDSTGTAQKSLCQGSHPILNCSIAEVVCDPDGTLRLRFTNGYRLVAYANDPAYEAYTLLLGGKEYVV
jgi:hypothetical protein